MNNFRSRFVSLFFVVTLLAGITVPSASAQSRPQRVEPKGGDKRNQRPGPKTPGRAKA